MFHEQLGSAGSDQPEHDLWMLDRFVDEVEQVRAAHELDELILYGHSWGAIVALEYALAHGGRLQALVLSNMIPSSLMHNRFVHEAITQLGLKLDHPELVPRMFAEHMLRLPVWPEEVKRSFGAINPRISQLLRGDHPFLIGGRLAAWDRIADLPRLTMPTLVLAARHDLGAEWLRQVTTTIPQGTFSMCPSGSHVAMWDDREVYLQHLQEFIDQLS